MPEWVEVRGRTAHGRRGVPGSGHRQLRVVERRHVPDRRRGKTSGPANKVRVVGDDKPGVVWGHRYTGRRAERVHRCATDVVSVWRAGETAGEGEFWFRDERRRKGHGDSLVTLNARRRGHDLCSVGLLRQLVQEAIASPQETPVFEHLRASRVELPEVSFPRRTVLARHFYEAVIQTQVVPDGVLPGRPALSVVGKLLGDVVAYLAQRKHLVGRLRNGHRDQSNVRVRRLDIVLVAL